jgi:hypothetical protein
MPTQGWLNRFINAFGLKTNAPKRFKNLRAQLWWEVGREGIDDGLVCLADLDEKTLAEIVAPKYSKNASGQIVVELKEDTRARLERSPDDADALLLAFHQGKSGQGTDQWTPDRSRAAWIGFPHVRQRPNQGGSAPG